MAKSFLQVCCGLFLFSLACFVLVATAEVRKNGFHCEVSHVITSVSEEVIELEPGQIIWHAQ